jgi:hypothetical protein
VVGARLNDPPLVQYVDPVGVLHRREPVRNDDGRPLPFQRIDAVLNVLRPERSEEVLVECALSVARKCF